MSIRYLPDRDPAGRGRDRQAAELAARITLDHPQLAGALRQTSAAACALAGRLERVIGSFSQHERDLEQAVRQVEARTGQPVDDGLMERLCERFGVTAVRPALERLASVHPDA